jgi:hypothetical protein
MTPKAIKGNVGHRDLCTEACTALWRLCREGGFAVAQAAIQRLGWDLDLVDLEGGGKKKHSFYHQI